MSFQTVEHEIHNVCFKTYKQFGHDDLTATLVTTLLLSDRELSMEELAKLTNYSLPSISLKMKMLLDHPVGINRISKPGTKKAYFYMEKDILKLNLRRMRMLYEVLIKGMSSKLLPLSKELKKTSKTANEKKKTKIIEQYLADLDSMEDAFKVFENKLKELIEKRKHK